MKETIDAQKELEDLVILVNENNPQLYNHILIQLFSSIVRITSSLSLTQTNKLFSNLRIFKEGIATTLFYFIKERAATPLVAHEELNFLSEAQYYRNIKKLKAWGFLQTVVKAQGRKVGGPKSQVLAIPSYTEDDLNRALDQERERITPFFDLSKRAYQIALENFIEPRDLDSFSRKEMIPIVNAFKIQGYQKVDVINQSCRLLMQDGIKVDWA